jgi:hypothetical protein
VLFPQPLVVRSRVIPKIFSVPVFTSPPSLTKNADEFYSMVEEAIAAHGWDYDSSAIRVVRVRMSLEDRAHRAAVYARQMADR